MENIWDFLDAIPRRGDVSPEELAARRQGYADLYAGGFLSRNSDQMPLSVQGAQVAQDFIPGIGDAIAFGEAGQALSRGELAAAGLLGTGALVGLVPGAGDALARPIMAAGRKVADAIPSEALYAGRSLAEGDMRGVLDAFAPSRPAQGLGADVVATGVPVMPATPAQEVANLLSSGRANEVTDEMLSKFLPKDEMEMFDLYQRGATGMDLPMDEASRMARATDMGFDTGTPLYHGDGGGGNVRAFHRANQPAYFAYDPHDAGDYASYVTNQDPDGGRLFGEGAQTQALVARANNTAQDADVSGAYESVTGMDRDYLPDDSWAPLHPDLSEDSGRVADELQRRGFDSVFFADDSTPINGEYIDSLAILNPPSNIRSRFARFDPRLKHLSNLSAGIGGLGLLSTMMPPEEQY